jgi:hypothetical protein
LLELGRGAADSAAYPPEALFPPVPLTFVRPGPGYREDPAGIERAVILAYTIQPNDLAAAGVTGAAPVAITAYDMAVSTFATPDGMTVRIYSGDDPTPVLDLATVPDPPIVFPPGLRFETTLDPRPIPLGVFGAGDTIYIAIGGGAVSAPEPGATALLGASALLLVRRRRRRVTRPGEAMWGRGWGPRGQ